MKKIFFTAFLLIILSCSGEKDRSVYYKRAYNYESELLNQYLAEFLINTEPYHQGKNIYLFDNLCTVSDKFSNDLKSCAESNKDINFKEALLDLSNASKDPKEINFSQIKNIKDIKLVAGPLLDIKPSYNNWQYRLSLPAYNKDSTLLCFTSLYYCGPLCASFSIIYMKKIEGKWTFFYEDNLMVS